MAARHFESNICPITLTSVCRRVSSSIINLGPLRLLRHNSVTLNQLDPVLR